jgi:hypothetical protein
MLSTRPLRSVKMHGTLAPVPLHMPSRIKLRTQGQLCITETKTSLLKNNLTEFSEFRMQICQNQSNDSSLGNDITPK